MGIVIRQINSLEDLNTIVDMLNIALNMDFPYKQETIAEYQKIYNQDYFKKFLQSKENMLFGAYAGQRLIGFISLQIEHGGVVFIDQLLVDKNYRGKKIGSRLMEKMEEISLSNGCHYVYLYTETPKDEKFYLNKGYKYIGTYDNAWFGEVEHIFAKSLTD